MGLTTYLVYIQIALLAGLIVLELRKRKGRDLVMITMALAIITFIDFQALFVGADVETFGSDYFLLTYIDRAGCRLAAELLLLGTIILLVSYWVTRRAKWGATARPLPQIVQTPLCYAVVIVILAGSTYWLVELSGGWAEGLSQPGRFLPGITVVLIIIQIGKMPLYFKIARRTKPNLVDFGLFATVFGFSIITHRQTAMFDLWELLIIYNYARRRVSFRVLTAVGAFAVVGIIVAGLARSNGVGYSSSTLGTIYQMLFEGIHGQTVNIVAFLYRWNIEAFTGFAGILTVYLQSGISYDYGLWYLNLPLHLLPYSIRMEYFARLEAWIDAAYPYHASIVAPGYQTAFAHFGFPGIVLFSAALGVLPRWFHSKLTAPGSDKVLYGMLSVDIVLLITYDAWLVVFFALADIAIWFLFRQIAQATAIAVRRSSPAPATAREFGSTPLHRQLGRKD